MDPDLIFYKDSFMKSLLRPVNRLVQKILGIFGLALIRTQPVENRSIINRSTMRGAIRALAKRGYQINTIIDIGASDGRWTLDAMEFFSAIKIFTCRGSGFS